MIPVGSYFLGLASGALKDVFGALKKKVTGPINRAIEGVGKKPTAQTMPKTVQESAGIIHPVTKEPISSSARKSGHYGPETYAGKGPDYTDKTYEGGGPKTQYNKAAALLVPLIIGVAWLAYIFLVGRFDIAAGQLSPSSINRQIFLLSLFIIIYSIFLILFSVGKEKAKKKIKKVKKKKK